MSKLFKVEVEIHATGVVMADDSVNARTHCELDELIENEGQREVWATEIRKPKDLPYNWIKQIPYGGSMTCEEYFDDPEIKKKIEKEKMEKKLREKHMAFDFWAEVEKGKQ